MLDTQLRNALWYSSLVLKSVHIYMHNELKAFFALCIYICIMCWHVIWEINGKAVKGLMCIYSALGLLAVRSIYISTLGFLLAMPV